MVFLPAPHGLPVLRGGLACLASFRGGDANNRSSWGHGREGLHGERFFAQGSHPRIARQARDGCVRRVEESREVRRGGVDRVSSTVGFRVEPETHQRIAGGYCRPGRSLHVELAVRDRAFEHNDKPGTSRSFMEDIHWQLTDSTLKR